MEMVELNEKALEAARNAIRADDVGDPLRLSDPALDTALGRVIHAYLAALPAPDDGLVERGIGIVWRWADWIISASEDMDEAEWPSASRDTVKADRDAVIVALQSQAEQIERLSVQLEASALVGVEISSRLEAAEQQVQKLSAENERMREASKASEFRDSIALGASPDEILRFRDGYPNPAGGSRVLFRYTIEQARYRYADAVLAARSDLKIQEGGE